MLRNTLCTLVSLLFSTINFNFVLASSTTQGAQILDDLPHWGALLKENSLKKIRQQLEVITNAQWNNGDFEFVNGVLVRAPLRLTYEAAVNYSIYPQMSSAIEKIHFQRETNTLEVLGQAGGLRLHSWFDVKFIKDKAVRYEVIGGDLQGFVVWTYFWPEPGGKSLVIARGHLPEGKKRFPALIQIAFPTVAEFVLEQATKNLRKFIEGGYNQRISTPSVAESHK